MLLPLTQAALRALFYVLMGVIVILHIVIWVNVRQVDGASRRVSNGQ